MIQKYLFSNDSFRDTIEQYEPKKVKKEVWEIESSPCWIAAFSTQGDNEDSAKILSKVHQYVLESCKPTAVLTSGCAKYYNKKLYPLFNEFERKLREYLYLKSTLSGQDKYTDLIQNLEDKDFGEIFDMLFTDEAFIKNTKTKVNEKTWKYTKQQIIETIQGIAESTLWNELIGSTVVPTLHTNFSQVREDRNGIMHAHNICEEEYNSARKNIIKINQELSYEIETIIGQTRKPEEQTDDESFSEKLSEALLKEKQMSENVHRIAVDLSRAIQLASYAQPPASFTEALQASKLSADTLSKITEGITVPAQEYAALSAKLVESLSESYISSTKAMMDASKEIIEACRLNGQHQKDDKQQKPDDKPKEDEKTTEEESDGKDADGIG